MSKKIKPAMIFSDHMILQRQKPVRVWGNCDGDMRITVRILGKESMTESRNGKWQVTLPALDTCESTDLEIFSDEEHIRIKDVAVGEVWLAGGQSNMEFHLRYDKDRKQAVENRHIRTFDYPEVAFEGQLERGDYSDYGFWRPCTEENLDYFSAVGYYFAMQLEKQYHVPVGIVGCNWGGTPACAWMDQQYLEGNEGRAWLEDYRKTLATLDMEAYEKQYDENPDNYRQKPFDNPFVESMMYGLSEEEFMKLIQGMLESGNENPVLPEGPRSEKRPGGLYETMLKKIAPYTIRGTIWYQGENDDQKADIYRTVFQELIHCWRDLWQEEIPFLFVQLAPFQSWSEDGRECFPKLRRAQAWVSRHVPNCWMATIMDVGMKKDIHPKNKKPVGERLALLARGHVYGEEILCDSPECVNMAVKDGKITLRFSNVGDGLCVQGERIQALEIFVDGEQLEMFDTEWNKDEIYVWNERVKESGSVLVKFAEVDYCEVNLYNSVGIPVAPFTREYYGNQKE